MPSLITPQEARDFGLTKFFTGQPCKHGHVAERMTCNGICVVCQTAKKNARRATREFKDRRNAKLISKRAAVREPKLCAVCRTPFDIMVGGRTAARTCSPECSEISYQRQARKPPDTECEHCFALFASRNPLQVACSRPCRDALDAEQRASRTRACLHCEEVFTIGDRRTSNGFCSDECRENRRVKVRAEYHQRVRLEQPEALRLCRQTYKIVNAEAHQRTVKMINDRRVAGETAAYEVAKQMIPSMLATARGYRNKIKMSVEFMRSLGINTNSHALENNDDTLRQAESRSDHPADQEQSERV